VPRPPRRQKKPHAIWNVEELGKWLTVALDDRFAGMWLLAATSGIEMLKTPYHAPRVNAICERFLGSVRA